MTGPGRRDLDCSISRQLLLRADSAKTKPRLAEVTDVQLCRMSFSLWSRRIPFFIRFKRNAALLFRRLISYITRLLFPLYLFPIKLVTYSIYYVILFLLRTVKRLIRVIFLSVIWPFRSKRNFAKTAFWSLIFLYFAFTEIRFASLVERYGGYSKFFCSEWLTSNKLKSSVVRVVGGYSEGSGFFVSGDQVLTSFHVIAGEPSPKIVFPDGSFLTPQLITANKDADLALLHLTQAYPQMILRFFSPEFLQTNEPLLSAGYPLGTSLPGDVTITKGFFSGIRRQRAETAEFLESTMSLVEGMSGGPTTDQCGDVVGVNTLSLAGLSLFVSSDSVQRLWPTFSDQDITKIEVDPSASPEEAVRAFYTYLKARRMEDGFTLLSRDYLQKTNFSEWTSRFTDILDVQIYVARLVEDTNDTVFVKFATKNWVDGETEFHYYEGTWQTVFEDGVYKMRRSYIQEVLEPGWEWFYED